MASYSSNKTSCVQKNFKDDRSKKMVLKGVISAPGSGGSGGSPR